MGFWDSIKSVAIQAKCATGFHGGEFKTPDGKPQCQLEKTCPDCMVRMTDEKHQYELHWRKAPIVDHSNCTRMQPCIHCGENHKHQVHNFKEAGINAKCEVVMQCSECSTTITKGEKHNYHRVGVDTRCNVVMKCKQCGKEKNSGREHRFYEHGTEGKQFIMKCSQCGTLERRSYR